MGGHTYSVDVEYSAPGSTHSTKSNATYSGGGHYGPKEGVKPDSKRVLRIAHSNPILLVLDGTGSMGTSAKVAYDKSPMIWGQIEQQRFLADPTMSLAIVGDEFSDRHPVQVSDFAVGLAIHEEFPKLFLEGGGGGTRQESYEAVIHYVLDHSEFDVPVDHAFAFIIGDEAPYQQHKDLTTKAILDQFGKTWDTWLLHRDYNGRGNKTADDAYTLKEWHKCFDSERIVCFHDMKALADILLGIIAIRMGKRTLDEYCQDMEMREQSPDRVTMVKSILSNVKPAPGVIVQSATDLADLAGLLALLGVSTVDAAVLKIDQLRGVTNANRPNVAGLYGILEYLKTDSVNEGVEAINALLCQP